MDMGLKVQLEHAIERDSSERTLKRSQLPSEPIVPASKTGLINPYRVVFFSCPKFDEGHHVRHSRQGRYTTWETFVSRYLAFNCATKTPCLAETDCHVQLFHGLSTCRRSCLIRDLQGEASNDEWKIAKNAVKQSRVPCSRSRSGQLIERGVRRSYA